MVEEKTAKTSANITGNQKAKMQIQAVGSLALQVAMEVGLLASASPSPPAQAQEQQAQQACFCPCCCQENLCKNRRKKSKNPPTPR